MKLPLDQSLPRSVVKHLAALKQILDKAVKYYLYDTDAERFNSIRLTDQDHSLINMHWKSEFLGAGWKPPIVEGFGCEDPGVEGDFPTLFTYASIPVFSQRAWDALKPLIGNWCEALPILHPTRESFYIINVVDIIDCLDEERSEVRRSKIDGRINRVFAYSFKSDLLKDKHIFKLPLQSGSDLLVSEEFRCVVEANSLKGLLFKNLPATY